MHAKSCRTDFSGLQNQFSFFSESQKYHDVIRRFLLRDACPFMTLDIKTPAEVGLLFRHH